MNNKKKNILVWIFTWAALLLVVLYSPLGSPDLYSSSNYYVGVPNANLSGSSIGNGANFSSESGSDNDLDIPDYSDDESPTKPSASYNYSAPASNTSSGTAASYSTSGSQTYQNSKDGSSGSTGGGGSTFISNNGSGGGSDASSTVSMSNGGITTLSSNVTTNSTLQAAPPSQTTGQHPPHDPKHPIPVGDGWVFLLLLAASYGIIKKRFFAHS